MKLILLMTTLCVVLLVPISALLTPSASMQIQAQPSYEKAANDQLQHSLRPLPRKLRLSEAVKEHGSHDLQSHNINRQLEGYVITGKSYAGKEEVEVHGQEWVEGAESDTSQILTMDYSPVRKRRPIHNKSMPVGP
ncbi:probable root meristem growth factor 8 [Juglans regia]|uniref:Probable root meristem growth factor 8 n=1 Tax=Juglans regia TaxID=51240 RepID=A0A6P9E7D8_JUGRE|nr:probable root meristem growth factor 8 [Juglans regia]